IDVGARPVAARPARGYPGPNGQKVASAGGSGWQVARRTDRPEPGSALLPLRRRRMNLRQAAASAVARCPARHVGPRRPPVTAALPVGYASPAAEAAAPESA